MFLMNQKQRYGECVLRGRGSERRGIGGEEKEDAGINLMYKLSI